MEKLSKENEELLARVLEYKHPEVIKKIVRYISGTTEQEAEDLFADVKKFLFYANLEKTPVSPSRRVDEAWHEFLVFTRDYANFCNTFFGKFIHHNPFTQERQLYVSDEDRRSDCDADCA